MKITSIVLIFWLLISCKAEVPIDKISVIDNFVLGKSISNISKQMDSLSIQRQRFCTKLILPKFNDLVDENNFIWMRYTNTFNLSPHQRNNQNLGLLYPITLTGTSNVIGMIIIFGHTGRPLLFGDAEGFKDSFSEKVFIQDINKNLINDIKNLYISKYGQPVDTFSMNSHNFYHIIGKEILENYDSDRRGQHINWKTEYLDISFFTGLPSYNGKYSISKNTYVESIHIFGEDRIVQVNQLENELQCFSYCYIKYELNAKAIEELNLNKKNF